MSEAQALADNRCKEDRYKAGLLADDAMPYPTPMLPSPDRRRKNPPSDVAIALWHPGN